MIILNVIQVIALVLVTCFLGFEVYNQNQGAKHHAEVCEEKLEAVVEHTQNLRTKLSECTDYLETCGKLLSRGIGGKSQEESSPEAPDDFRQPKSQTQGL